MSETMKTEKSNILVAAWASFRAMPTWVQIWVGLWLMPVNMASLFFIGGEKGILIAFLANIAMMLNLPVMLLDRGFSKAMALPHIIPWTILIGILLFARPEASGMYDTYLTVLLVTNIISLLFDYPDAIKWFGGDRAIAA